MNNRLTQVIVIIFLFLLSNSTLQCRNTVNNVIDSEANIRVNKINYDESGVLYPFELNNSYGYIDINGCIIIKPTLLFASPFAEGLGFIKLDQHKGAFLDSKGNFIIELNCIKSTVFYEGKAIATLAQRGDLVSIIFDKKGNIVYRGHIIVGFSDGMALEDLPSGKLRYIDSNGYFRFEAPSMQMGDFHCGLAKFLREGKWGYIDKNGKVRIEPKYVDASDFAEGLAAVQDYDKGIPVWKYINIEGQLCRETDFNYCGAYSEGLAPYGLYYNTYTMSMLYGFIEKTGRKVTNSVFTRVSEYSDGLAAVKMLSANRENIKNITKGLTDIVFDYGDEGKYGYIDKEGNLVIDIVYNDAQPFMDGLAYIKDGNQEGYIDKTGHFVWSKIRET